MTRVEKIGRATLYLGDARDVLPTLSKVDAVVTDPPWGIEYGSGTSNRKRGKAIYDGSFEDTRANVRDIVVPAVVEALALSSGVGAVTPGSPCAWLYPEPVVLGGFYQPATKGLNRWGYASLGPVLFYGRNPRAGKALGPTAIVVTDPPSWEGHPCSKPIRPMRWLVDKVSLPGATILDPFMGSGTTGVACMETGRDFIGIELSARYFDDACKRIEDAQRQGNLFGEAA